MRYEISGNIMQTVAIDLAPGETVYSQTNTMAWMNDQVTMNTNTGGGFFAGIARTFGGGSFRHRLHRQRRRPCRFAPRFPGSIVPAQLQAGQSLVCRKETFLVAREIGQLEVAWQSGVGAGFFGGDGFILQKISGPGVVGSTSPANWSSATSRRASGCWSTPATSAYSSPASASTSRWSRLQEHPVRRRGPVPGELTGPGHVWLQSMPILNLAEEIGRYIPRAGGDTGANSTAGGIAAGAALGAAGGLLGSLFGGSES